MLQGNQSPVNKFICFDKRCSSISQQHNDTDFTLMKCVLERFDQCHVLDWDSMSIKFNGGEYPGPASFAQSWSRGQCWIGICQNSGEEEGDTVRGVEQRGSLWLEDDLLKELYLKYQKVRGMMTEMINDKQSAFLILRHCKKYWKLNIRYKHHSFWNFKKNDPRC